MPKVATTDDVIKRKIAWSVGWISHVDVNGKAVLSDGECAYCGQSGEIAGFECPARLRFELDAALIRAALSDLALRGVKLPS